MADEITSFALRDAAMEFTYPCNDGTVAHSRMELIHFWMGDEDRLISVTKMQWDHLNRILLLLASDAEMTTEMVWQPFHLRNALAILGLLGWTGVALRYGLSLPLLVATIHLAILSKALDWLKPRKPIKSALVDDDQLSPFPTAESLRLVRERTAGFVDLPYRPELATRERPSFGDFKKFTALKWQVLARLAVLLAPLHLFEQMAPGVEMEHRIVIPEPSSTPDAAPGAS